MTPITPFGRPRSADAGAVEYFKDTGRRLRNWGRWGDNDQRGTLNFISADHVVAAGGLVRRGKCFSLGIPIADGRAHRAGLRAEPLHLMSLMPGDLQHADGSGFLDDVIMMPLQCGSHWDALSHCFYDDEMYNGYPLSSVTALRGPCRLGIEQTATGIAGRGVLLDIAALKGVDCLPIGLIVTPEDLDAAERRQSVSAGAGDILLIRTGWRRKTMAPPATAMPPPITEMTRLTFAPEPGLSQACCEWIHRRRIAAIASDNYALEVLPVEDSRATLPVHCILIRDMGMTIGELFDLEALAADCRQDQVWEFFFAAPALPVARGVGSPINPLAIK